MATVGVSEDGEAIEGIEVDFEDGAGEGRFAGVGEEARGCTIVSVAPLGDVELGAVGAKGKPVGGVALFGAREAANNIYRFPFAILQGEASDNARVSIEVGISVEGDSRIAGRDVENRLARSAGDSKARDLTIAQIVAAAVVVVISDFFDEVDFFYGGGGVDIALFGDGEGVDSAVLLGDVEPSVGAELEGGGICDQGGVAVGALELACRVKADINHGSHQWIRYSLSVLTVLLFSILLLAVLLFVAHRDIC